MSHDIINSITVAGSAKYIIEFLRYGIDTILYRRGIYPSESFKEEEHLELKVVVSIDEKINSFLNKALSQVKEWLVGGNLKKIAVVITDISTTKVIEKWDFIIKYDKVKDSEIKTKKVDLDKQDMKIVQNEIQVILRQIFYTVSFLPPLDCRFAAFDLLIYTDLEANVPDEWDLTGPSFVSNSEEVKLRTFSTAIHKLDTFVMYKKMD